MAVEVHTGKGEFRPYTITITVNSSEDENTIYSAAKAIFDESPRDSKEEDLAVNLVKSIGYPELG